MIQSYDQKLEFTDEKLKFYEFFPTFKGFNQWPKLTDIQNLDIQKVKVFEITHFEFFDLVKNGLNGNWNKRISFRLYTSSGQKSPVSGYVDWVNSPVSYDSYLTKVDLTQVKKICVVTFKHSRDSVPKNFVCWIVFYDKTNNVSHIANATGGGSYTTSNV